jgi:hypothetical protein
MNNRGLILGRGKKGFFLSATVFRLALGLTQPSVQWVPDSPPSSASAKIMNAWSRTSVSPLRFHGVVFKQVKYLHDVVLS